MNKVLLTLVALAFCTTLFAQGGSDMPEANWQTIVPSKAIKKGKTIELTFETDIEEGYHIYSNDYGDCPPVKAKFTYQENKTFALVGDAQAIGSHRYIDDIFECEVADFEKKAVFKQKIKICDENPDINGVLKYQMCSPDGRCVQFEYAFKVKGINVK